MQHINITLNEIPCIIYSHIGSNDSLYTIYMAIDDHDEQELPVVVNTILEEHQNKNVILIAYKVQDWNCDLSPWKAPPVFGKIGFDGKGVETLVWLTSICKPYIEESFIPTLYGLGNITDETSIVPIIGGYSLAGLFALWTFYESQEFQYVMSASGSVWFPGWSEYVVSRMAPAQSIVYLSLGDTEEKAKQPIMASVGDRTRELFDLVQADHHVRTSTLESNQGGYFVDSGLRTGKGFSWILKQLAYITPQCSWGTAQVDKDYHDYRWCKPVHDDDELFAMLCLEGMQAGLSWTIVLKKEVVIREAFCGLTPQAVSTFTEADLEELQHNPNIIRHKLKLKAVVTNGQAFRKVQEEFGSFDTYIWSFTNGQTIVNHPKIMSDIATESELSQVISKDLKKRGFKFVGPVIIYSYLQAIGIVNDHLDTCAYK